MSKLHSIVFLAFPSGFRVIEGGSISLTLVPWYATTECHYNVIILSTRFMWYPLSVSILVREVLLLIPLNRLATGLRRGKDSILDIRIKLEEDS